MADWQRESQLFDVSGLNLSKPVDRLAPGEYRILNNCRPYGQGRVQGRQGMTLVSASGTTGDPAHSLFTFDDPIPSPTLFPGAFQHRVRLLGSGTIFLTARDPVNPTAYTFTTESTGYSGRPMSFVTSGSDQNERPWAFIGDFTKISKTSSAGLTWQWGVSPPNFAPVIALGAVNPDGPDVGQSPNPYIYAFRARTDALSITGCVSNLGPAVRFVNGLSPAGQNILITLPIAHPDQAPTGQVAYIDVFRWGGSLPIWLFIGTMQNTAGNTMIDSFSDADIASNEQAPLDDNQPFMSVDGTITGTATIVDNGTGLGSTMTITAGDTFRAYNATGSAPYYVAGNAVTIGGQVYTFYASPDTTTTVQLLENTPGAATFSDFFLIPSPEMARTALPCIWGPFGGGLFGTVIFACGDQHRPGALYWTKGNSPESHPTANVLEITSANEPLMNGILFNGRSYVLSDKRMWEVIPTLGQLSDFSAIEIPNSKGLYARWGICVTPAGIVFIGKDGIYITNGGEPVSLSDEALYPIFPQESQGPASGFPVIDGLADAPFPLPDFDHPDDMRLAYGDGFLYFTYRDMSPDPTYRTLVYCFEMPKSGWISVDTYTPNIKLHYFEQVHDEIVGGSWNKVVMGSVHGKVYEFGGNDDDQQPIAGRVRTSSWDAKDPRPRKLWGDVEIDMDGECDTFDVLAGFDNYSFFSALGTAGTNIHGRHRVTCDINAGLGQYAYNIGLDIQWTVSTSQPILYFWIPTMLPKPELTALRTTDWLPITQDGSPRFVQGFRLHADTLNQTRTVEALSDGGVTQETFQILHPNEQTIEYWFTTPFISHLGRLLPRDAKFWRIFNVEWISEPVPPLAAVWETQEITHDYSEFWHSRAILPALISFNDDVTMTCIVNGDSQSPYVYTIPANNGLFLKPYTTVRPMKCRAMKYRFTSICPFRLFLRDSSTLVKAWGSNGPYDQKKVFGDFSHDYGARI